MLPTESGVFKQKTCQKLNPTVRRNSSKPLRGSRSFFFQTTVNSLATSKNLHKLTENVWKPP